MKRTSKYLSWPGLLMAMIFVESSIPMDGGPDNIAFLTNLDPTIQNLLHIPLYGTLAYLWMKALQAMGLRVKQIVFFSMLITLSYGCFDEFHQSFVPGRYGGLLDIYLNVVGTVAGMIVFLCPLWAAK